MYATALRCSFCDADFPLTNLASCTHCGKPGEENALNETLGVTYDLAALKKHLGNPIHLPSCVFFPPDR